MRQPVDPSLIGALFSITSDAVVVLEGDEVQAWNRVAETFFGVSVADAEAPRVLKELLAPLLALPLDAPAERVAMAPLGHVSAVHRPVGERHVLLLRDVTDTVRREEGLRRIAALSRQLLGSQPSVQAVLQTIAEEAKALTGAAYSALLLLREGSTTESSHFVYDAPRALFPERMPRAVGLLAVPLATRQPARLDDVRGHPAGVGLPGVHPPLGPLVAVPLVAGDAVLGEVAVANAPGGRPFDEVDEALLVDLAAHATAAVAWAQGVEREREAALVRQEVVDTARHDIRTPVGAGKGFALLLQRRRDRMTSVQVETALQGLVDAFARIESFSERLLVDERTAAGSVAPLWAVVEVDPLVRAVQRDAEALSGREGVVVWRHEDAPPTLAGDPEMVREVLDNLVGNAVKHAGSATVTARVEGEHVRFDVRDEGPGIPEADQARLFDRWTRGDATRRASVDGFGLGLSIVKRLVVAHGGTLGVSSRPDEGATFWVTFPRTAPVGA
ncbi:MAG: two-component sensor kinase, involved in phosphate sensing [Frankiales bacterium]|nr:two-component sensor kinase, involved in phosphate sensing [Frankiales bacterium]